MNHDFPNIFLDFPSGFLAGFFVIPAGYIVIMVHKIIASAINQFPIF
jgi:hypothetical protein